MDYIKAVKIAKLFEEDYKRKYKLLSIEDERNIFHDKTWFRCKFLDKVRNRVIEIEFPENAIEICRAKAAEDWSKYAKYKEIEVDGSNVFWDEKPEEAEIIQGDFEAHIQEIADEIKRLLDENFDLSKVFEDEMTELKENVEKLYEKMKKDKSQQREKRY